MLTKLIIQSPNVPTSLLILILYNIAFVDNQVRREIWSGTVPRNMFQENVAHYNLMYDDYLTTMMINISGLISVGYSSFKVTMINDVHWKLSILMMVIQPLQTIVNHWWSYILDQYLQLLSIDDKCLSNRLQPSKKNKHALNPLINRQKPIKQKPVSIIKTISSHCQYIVFYSIPKNGDFHLNGGPIQKNMASTNGWLGIAPMESPHRLPAWQRLLRFGR